MKLLLFIQHLAREWSTGLGALLPNDLVSTRLRRLIYRANGVEIAKPAYVYRNVLLLGKVSIGRGSSISNNTSINGATAGIQIGEQVMIAPGCCLVAFDHGIALTGVAGHLLAEAIAGTAERFDVFGRIEHREFPGGAALRRPALMLAMLWYRLKDLL